jgi:WD40 repeat protein
MTFNPAGTTLASVASAPDYMLTLWSWTDEKILLHSKAFGQEIYTVRFSEHNPSSLTTSGTGHIRFWKMASTFTGMKLQGSIGKFGKVELSDISAFVELPDGKVCSGTESGAILLWEGNFIKCRFVCPGGSLCHDGEITSMEIDHIKGCIVTAGLDGYLKWWDLEVIDAAEVDSDHSMDFIIQPLSETRITSHPGSGIRSIFYHHKTLTPDLYELLRESDSTAADFDSLFILDTTGLLKLVRSPSSAAYGLPAENQITTLHSSHGSEISCLDCSPIGYVAVTGGMDGRLIFWDVRGRVEIASKQFDVPVTALSWIPIHIDPTGQSICVGFRNGQCKVLRLNRDIQLSNKDKASFSIIQTMVMKPHNAAITHISFSNSSQLLVTAGKDGILFFFHCKQKYINGQLSMYSPLRFIRLKKNSTEAAASSGAATKFPIILCSSLAWSGSCLLIGCSDGIAREIDSEIILAATNEDVESYESVCQLREIVMKIAPPLSAAPVIATESKESKTEEEAPPAAPGKILKCVYSFAFDNSRHDKYYAAVTATFASSSQSSSQTLCSLQEGSFLSEVALKEYSFGCYDNSSKDIRKTPQITCMKYGISREFLAVGQLDGTISVLPVNHLTTYLTAPAHNSICGGVSCVSLSYDNKYLISTGYDGLLVVHRLKPLEILEAAQQLATNIESGMFLNKTKSIPRQLSPSAPSFSVDASQHLPGFPSLYDNVHQAQHPEQALDDIVKMLPDIEEIPELSPTAYSIEDAKLKQEEDNKKSAADIKKDKIRVIVNKLRKEFEELKYHNSQLPEVIQLTPEELLVDREYFEKLEKEEEKVVSELHLECEYSMEKSLRLKEKMYSRLMAELLVEEMPLFGLRQKKPPKVHSLRTIGLTPEMYDLLEKYSLEIKREEEVLSKAKIDAILASDLDNAANSTGPVGSRLLNRGESMQSVANKSIDSLLHQSQGHKIGTARSIKGGAGTGHHKGTGATRRELRLQRIETIQTHLQKKPNENDDDERDIQAINHAVKTIGNYSLKSSDTYEVPEDQIINAEKKKRQIIMLQEAMIVLRLQFNERFLLLRKLKIEIIDKMKYFNHRLVQINHELDIMEMVNAASKSDHSTPRSPHLHANDVIWQPELKTEEFPDDREEITKEEIEDYQQRREKGEWSKVTPPKHQIYTGTKTVIEGDNSAPVKGKFLLAKSSSRNPFRSQNTVRLSPEEMEGKVKLSSKEDTNAAQSALPLQAHLKQDTVLCFKGVEKLATLNHAKLESSIPVLAQIKLCTQQARFLTEKQISATLRQLNTNKASIPAPLSSAAHGSSALSSDDKKLMNEYRRQLLFEKQSLLQKISEYISNFDQNIEDLRHERHVLISNLKLSELKLLTYVQEYNLLLTYEEKDNYLKSKNMKFKTEKLDLEAQTTEIQTKLDFKVEDFTTFTEKLATLFTQYKNMIPGGESHQFYEILTKIYKKKIKRIKNIETEGLDDDEDLLESDEENDDDDEFDDDDIDDICPNGCDVTLYDQVIALREKKLDVDEVLTDLQKAIDELKKSKDRFKQREKQIDKDLKASELEIQNFQRQKQGALNKIEVYIPLRVSQIHSFMTSGVLSGPPKETEGGSHTASNQNLNATTESGTETIDNVSVGSESVGETQGTGTGIPMSHEERLLMNSNRRALVAEMDMTSHTVFKTS